MRWVKVHTSLRHHPLLRRCSTDAQLLFRICLEIAGDYEQGDALAMRGPKGPIPMTVCEIAIEAGIKTRACVDAIGELLEAGMIELRQPECYFIPRFTEKTASSTSRVQAFRKRQRKRVSETDCNGFSNGVTKRTEVEVESRDSVSPLANARSDTAPRRSPKERKTPKKAQKPEDTSWVEPLRLAVKTVVATGKELRDLTIDERFILAQYHAWRWAFCTKNEKKNKAAARKISRQIGSIANDKTYGQLTVKDYVTHGEAVWKAGAESPWWEPWDIKARVEIEASA